MKGRCRPEAAIFETAAGVTPSRFNSEHFVAAIYESVKLGKMNIRAAYGSAAKRFAKSVMPAACRRAATPAEPHHPFAVIKEAYILMSADYN